MKVLATVHLTADDIALAISKHIQAELGATADVVVNTIDVTGQDLYEVVIGNVAYPKSAVKTVATAATTVKRRRRTKVELEQAQAAAIDDGAVTEDEQPSVATEAVEPQAEDVPEVTESDVPAVDNPFKPTAEDRLYQTQPSDCAEDFM